MAYSYPSPNRLSTGPAWAQRSPGASDGFLQSDSGAGVGGSPPPAVAPVWIAVPVPHLEPILCIANPVRHLGPQVGDGGLCT